MIFSSLADRKNASIYSCLVIGKREGQDRESIGRNSDMKEALRVTEVRVKEVRYLRIDLVALPKIQEDSSVY